MSISAGVIALLLIGIGLILLGGRIRRRSLASGRSAAALAIRGRPGLDADDDRPAQDPKAAPRGD